MDSSLIHSGEQLDDLQLNGIKLIQNPDWFCFGVDAVLLSDYASKSIKKDSSVLDLCSGNGIIPILLSQKSSASHITGLELQKPVEEMAERSVKYNNLQNKISMVCGDLKDAAEIFGKSSFQYITCNPPYKEAGGGLLTNTDITAIARHEIMCSLEDVVRVSSILLEPRGKLCMIHRPERLAEVIYIMKKYRLEPKRMRFIHSYANKSPVMFLIESARCGNPKLFIDPPLYIYERTGVYSSEINRIYGRKDDSK